jgi:endonuclease/exonuclease/phosphatase (EEP) superfamily protein YafD
VAEPDAVSQHSKDRVPRPAARLGVLIAGAALGAPAAAGTLFAYLARLSWAFDLFSHWRVQYTLLLLASTVLLLAARRWRLALLPAALAALNLAAVLPVYRGGGDYTTPGRPLRLVSANIEASNTHSDKVLDLVAQEDPDVLVLTEFTYRWFDDLHDLDARYPDRVLLPHDDNFGIALYSRLPIVDWQPLEAFDADLRGVLAHLSASGRTFTLIAVHTVPPIGGEASRLRNRQLRQLARLARGVSGPLLLAGDLNTSPWSPNFADLLSESGLRDSRRGFGVEPTWPSFFPPPMRTPIDHCLAPPTVRILDRCVGPYTGSDHLPIVVDFALPGE